MTTLQPLALALIVAGVLMNQATAGAQTLKKVADSGTITVSYRESSVPFSYLAGGTEPVGFAVELSRAIVNDVRQAVGQPALAVRYVPVTGANRIPLLVDGSYDLECGSTTNTAARGKEVSFAISHFYAGTRLLTSGNSGVRNYADLAGKRVASVAGSTNEKVLRKVLEDRKIEAQIVLAKDYAESLQLVERGEAVAVALDDILLYGLRANAETPASLQVVGDMLQVEPYGCMVRRDDPAFKALVDRTIARMMKSGEFSRLYSRWFESPIPPKGVSLNMPMSEALRANLQALSDQPAP